MKHCSSGLRHACPTCLLECVSLVGNLGYEEICSVHLCWDYYSLVVNWIKLVWRNCLQLCVKPFCKSYLRDSTVINHDLIVNLFYTGIIAYNLTWEYYCPQCWNQLLTAIRQMQRLSNVCSLSNWLYVCKMTNIKPR